MKWRDRGNHDGVKQFEGSIDVCIDGSTRGDRLSQRHQRDFWLEHSEIRLGDVTGTANGPRERQNKVTYIYFSLSPSRSPMPRHRAS